MKSTENNAVNEWNEGAEPPKWYDDNFWQTVTPDFDEDTVFETSPPIREAADITAPSAMPHEEVSDS